MKKIINNKLYDTKISKTVFKYKHKWLVKSIFFPKEYGFVKWEDVTIFKTRHGNYFNYYNDDEYSERERIEPTTLEEVKDTIASLNPDKYIELFGKNDIEEA